MDPKLVTPLLFAAFVAFAIYRRVRRNIGRQRVQPMRMRSRIILFGVIGALVLAVSARNVEDTSGSSNQPRVLNADAGRR